MVAEIRVHSRREESRKEFSARLSRDFGKTITVNEDRRSAVEAADIIGEGSRMDRADAAA